MIVRTVVYNHHFKKKVLCSRLYQPPFNTDKVSMMRVIYIGVDECKRISREVVENPAAQKFYKGLATISAASIRNSGALIEDSPNDKFLGHANLRMGFVRQKNEPLQTTEEQEAYDKRLDALFAATLYFEDPDPNVPGWKGAELTMK